MESKRHMEYVRNIIIKRELYFSDPSTFNDPYDCNIGLHLRSYLKPCGVLCLSTSECDLIPMFSHYADRHKGVCLHFEIDDDDSHDEIAPFNGKEVDYKDIIPPFKDAKQAHMTLLTKYKKWEYEKEYRVFKNVESENDRIMKYKPGQLRGAIFGLHMTADDSFLIKHWFKLGGHENVFFKKAELSADGFALRLADMNSSNTSEEAAAIDATAASYVEHAREINAIARTTLRLDTRDATSLAGKISLGLSLQAGELAGKGILRSLGHSVEQIRKQHKQHDLLTLLRQAEKELRARPEKEFAPYHHFLLWTPEIDGTQFGTTVGRYLEDHFSRGPSARPRSYFYPDEPVFTGPVPIQALLIMIGHLIDMAEKVVALTESL